MALLVETIVQLNVRACALKFANAIFSGAQCFHDLRYNTAKWLGTWGLGSTDTHLLSLIHSMKLITLDGHRGSSMLSDVWPSSLRHSMP